MATSSAFNTSNQYIKYTITVNQDSQSVQYNHSCTTVSVRFYRTNTGYSSYGKGTVYCKIDGTTYSAAVTSSQKITNSGIVLFTKQLNVDHNSDGTKTLVCSAWISHDVVTSSEQSYSQTLTTIARASQPSCITWPDHTQNVGNFGDTISIHMNRKSESFTHTVRYAYGNLTGTIATNVGTGTTWTIPNSFMNEIPNATSGSGTIYVDTYNGSTLVGTKWCGFTATVPASVKPSVDATGRLTVITDGGVNYGKPVQGLSKIKVDPVITTAYSSPIKTCTITVQGKSYSGTSITSDVLSDSGMSSVTVTVTDNRNRSSSWSYNEMDVMSYAPPRVTDLKVHRVDADGNEDMQGTWVKVTFSASVTSLNSQNTASYSIKHKITNDQDYTTVSLDALDNNLSVSNYVYTFSADIAYAYDIEVLAADRHYSGYRSTSVSTAFALMDWHRSGTGIAFGKLSQEKNLMDVGLDANFEKEVYYKGKTLLDFFYPVGSIYIAYNHTDPGTLFGGTWERIREKFLWATSEQGNIGATGGESTHTLTVAEMPSHTHKDGTDGTTGFKATMVGSGASSAAVYFDANTGRDTTATGGGQAHNNMPPYIQVSIWRRTA